MRWLCEAVTLGLVYMGARHSAIGIALALELVGCRADVRERTELHVSAVESASEPPRAPVWFSFQRPQVEAEETRSPTHANAFVVAPDGEFCVRVVAIPKFLYHGGTAADTCAEGRDVWCRGRLEASDIEALDALLHEDDLAAYLKDAIPAHGTRLATPLMQRLHVVGLREQLMTPEDPHQFYRHVGLLAHFEEPSKLSEKTRQLTQTLVEIRDRVTAANSCNEPPAHAGRSANSGLP